METERFFEPVYPVLLAAGSSSRLSPYDKKLLVLKSSGQTLIEHCICAARDCSLLQKPLTVVLGDEASKIRDRILPYIDDNLCSLVINPNHKEGLTSSICCGVSNLLQIAGVQGFSILLFLVDQFEISTDHFNQLVRLHRQSCAEQPITATSYQTQGFGPPVIFSSHYLKALVTLKGNHGARSIISGNQDQLQTLENPRFSGADIDTMEDVRNAANSIHPPAS